MAAIAVLLGYIQFWFIRPSIPGYTQPWRSAPMSADFSHQHVPRMVTIMNDFLTYDGYQKRM